MGKSKELSFKDEVLSRLNKSADQIKEEALSDKIEDFIIQTDGQISMIKTVYIPSATQELKVAKRELTKANKELKECFFSVLDKSYPEFIDSIQSGEERVFDCQIEVDRVESEIKTSKAQLKKYESLLSMLKK